MIKVKRAYEPASSDDGYRILVDRLWPRGISKEKSQLGEWMKEVSPSTELRKWFSHDPAKWSEFKDRYRQELADKTDYLDAIKEKASKGDVTLVYGAKDKEFNQAIALKDFIEQSEV